MRHLHHRHSLGVKSAHRQALLGNLAASLFVHGRIKTTLAKAKALRPFSEQLITLAKKAAATEDTAKKLHYRRLAIARVRDVDAVHVLFDEKAEEFVNRKGGYTRIYKLGTRVGDAAEMAIIELVNADDEGHSKPGKKAKKASQATSAPKAEAPAVEEEVQAEASQPEVEDPAETEESPVEEESPAEEPKKDS